MQYGIFLIRIFKQVQDIPNKNIANHGQNERMLTLLHKKGFLVFQ